MSSPEGASGFVQGLESRMSETKNKNVLSRHVCGAANTSQVFYGIEITWNHASIIRWD